MVFPHTPFLTGIVVHPFFGNLILHFFGFVITVKVKRENRHSVKCGFSFASGWGLYFSLENPTSFCYNYLVKVCHF